MISQIARWSSCFALLIFLVSPLRGDTVFSSGFEYTAGNPVIGTDMANLNGADGQIGTFSGSIPESAGGQFSPELVGFEANPSGGQLMWLDRPLDDGTFYANLASAIIRDGATISVDLGTRRTGGIANAKDYDFIGLDQNDNESFRLRVDTVNNSGERFVVVTDNGNTVIVDLPTTSGDDAGEDLNNTGGTPFTESDIAQVSLSLGAGGYTLDFARDTLAYTTDVLPYNGSATSLSRIAITYQGDAGANNARAGYIMDNLTVDGVLVPEPSTLAMLGLALAAFGLLGTRRIR